MEDIAPKLLKAIQADFNKWISESKHIAAIYELIKNGNADYKTANQFAIEAGELLSSAYVKHITSQILPDGRMYYNIADKVITPTMTNNYDLISEMSANIQAILNEKAGIGIKPIRASMRAENIKSIIDSLTSRELFADIAYMLREPVITYSQSVVDDMIKANFEFHGKAGLEARIVRVAEGGCCKWCSGLAGEYSYPDAPEDVYRRHNNCKCFVTYEPGDGRKQNVHSKRWVE